LEEFAFLIFLKLEQIIYVCGTILIGISVSFLYW